MSQWLTKAYGEGSKPYNPMEIRIRDVMEPFDDITLPIVRSMEADFGSFYAIAPFQVAEIIPDDWESELRAEYGFLDDDTFKKARAKGLIPDTAGLAALNPITGSWHLMESSFLTYNPLTPPNALTATLPAALVWQKEVDSAVIYPPKSYEIGDGGIYRESHGEKGLIAVPAIVDHNLNRKVTTYFVYGDDSYVIPRLSEVTFAPQMLYSRQYSTKQFPIVVFSSTIQALRMTKLGVYS